MYIVYLCTSLQRGNTHHVATDLDAKNEGMLRIQALRLHPAPVEIN